MLISSEEIMLNWCAIILRTGTFINANKILIKYFYVTILLKN